MRENFRAPVEAPFQNAEDEKDEKLKRLKWNLQAALGELRFFEGQVELRNRHAIPGTEPDGDFLAAMEKAKRAVAESEEELIAYRSEKEK